MKGDELRETAFLWGPNRYGDRAVMRVVVPDEDARQREVAKAAAHLASRLVAATTGWPAQGTGAGDAAREVVFETPLDGLGRFAFLEARRMVRELGSGREVGAATWEAALGRTRAWLTDADRRVIALLAWAEANDVPVRPLEPPSTWLVGEGVRATTFHVDDALEELAASHARGQVGAIPWISVAGEHGKTACGRVLAHAFATWNVPSLYVGDTARPTAMALLDPRAKIGLVEAPAFDRAPCPLAPRRSHVTVILDTAGSTKGRMDDARYAHYLGVARRTRAGGVLVIDADDAVARRVADEVDHELHVVAFSVGRHAGGRGRRRAPHVAIREGHVLAKVRGQMRPQLALAELGRVGGHPAAFGAPLAAAFAALLAGGFKPRDEIATALSRFQSTARSAPGCFNLHRARGARVLVHRAHDAGSHGRLLDEVDALVERQGLSSVHGLYGLTSDASPEVVADVHARYQARCASVATLGRTVRGAVSVPTASMTAFVADRLGALGPRDLLLIGAPDITNVSRFLAQIPHR